MESTDKKHTVIISEEAADMLAAHSGFLAQISEQTALNLITQFNKKAKSLEKFPKRNPSLSDSYLSTKKYLKLLICKRYLLIYQIKGSTVYADAVVD